MTNPAAAGILRQTGPAEGAMRETEVDDEKREAERGDERETEVDDEREAERDTDR